MIRAEQIPPEVVDAAAITLMGRLMVSQQDALHVWSGMYEPEKDQFRREARASIAAALNAWPGVVLYPPDVLDNTINPTRIILPLPQENANAES